MRASGIEAQVTQFKFLLACSSRSKWRTAFRRRRRSLLSYDFEYADIGSFSFKFEFGIADCDVATGAGSLRRHI